MDQISLLITGQGLNRQTDPPGAEGAVPIKPIGAQGQAIQLPEQAELQRPKRARCRGLNSRALRSGIGGEEATVHPLLQQAPVEPEGATGSPTAEIARRDMQHPHGASTR